MPALLLSNPLAADANGRYLRREFDQCGVKLFTSDSLPSASPEIFVVSDENGTRTWFPYLRGVSEALEVIHLDRLRAYSLVYVDCYELIQTAAARALQFALDVGRPVFLNLSTSVLPAAVRQAVAGRLVKFAQISVGEGNLADGVHSANRIAEAVPAENVLVTAGADGAMLVTPDNIYRADALRLPTRHLHGAGAAFSAGFIYAFKRDYSPQDSLLLACASGSWRCAASSQSTCPTEAELRAFIDTHGM